MCIHRTFLGSILAIVLFAPAQCASAVERFEPLGHGTLFGAPIFVGSEQHGEAHLHHHGRQERRRHDRHGDRRAPGKGYLTLHTFEHRHGRHGWHVHREWRRQRHPETSRHRGPRRNDDWGDGAGVALGLLAGMLLFGEFADGGNAVDNPGHTATHFSALDVHSRQRRSRAIRHVLEAGGNSVATWANPANRRGGASGEVRITRNGRDRYGNTCREYHQTVRVGNRAEQAFAVACRDRKGNWHLQP